MHTHTPLLSLIASRSLPICPRILHARDNLQAFATLDRGFSASAGGPSILKRLVGARTSFRDIPEPSCAAAAGFRLRASAAASSPVRIDILESRHGRGKSLLVSSPGTHPLRRRSTPCDHLRETRRLGGKFLVNALEDVVIIAVSDLLYCCRDCGLPWLPEAGYAKRLTGSVVSRGIAVTKVTYLIKADLDFAAGHVCTQLPDHQSTP